MLFPVPVGVRCRPGPGAGRGDANAGYGGRRAGTAGPASAFDWGLAAGLGRDVVVAGGLDPENVAEAVEPSAAWGVDVASGIESSPGEKDAEADATIRGGS